MESQYEPFFSTLKEEKRRKKKIEDLTSIKIGWPTSRYKANDPTSISEANQMERRRECMKEGQS